MDIDFPLVLVVLTFVTGAVWLADIAFLRKRRLAGAEQGGQVDESADEFEDREPWLVDISRSFFPPVLAVVLVLRSFLIEPFQIPPSGSMLPTSKWGGILSWSTSTPMACACRWPVPRLLRSAIRSGG